MASNIRSWIDYIIHGQVEAGLMKTMLINWKLGWWNNSLPIRSWIYENDTDKLEAGL